MPRYCWPCPALLAPLLLLGLAGCGASTVKVQGRVVVNGQTPKWLTGMVLQLVGGAPAGKETHPGYASECEIGPDGTFTIYGGEGKGVPPGTYKVLLVGGLPRDPEARALVAPFAAEKTTPITFEVKGRHAQSVVIDLAQRTVRQE